MLMHNVYTYIDIHIQNIYIYICGKDLYVLFDGSLFV